MKSRHPPPGNPNVVSDSVNTAVSVKTSSHGQTGQSQCMIVEHLSHDQVLVALKPNTMYVGEGSTPKEPASTEVLNANNPTGQGQSQAYTESKIYATATDKMGSSGHDQTGQDQSQTISETNTTTMCTQLTNEHDQTGQGQSQTISETNTNTTCTRLTNEHDQTGQGQSQTISETNTNTTCTQLTNEHDQTGQGQGQTISETNRNTTCTQLTNEHDQTGQGQGQTIAETNRNTTATLATMVMIRQGRTGQGQTISETNRNTRATLATNGYDQTGQVLRPPRYLGFPMCFLYADAEISRFSGIPDMDASHSRVPRYPEVTSLVPSAEGSRVNMTLRNIPTTALVVEVPMAVVVPGEDADEIVRRPRAGQRCGFSRRACGSAGPSSRRRGNNVPTLVVLVQRTC
ncbi:corticospinal neuron axon guidance through spinal cord [Branchiostoma belcheri]|nr:corticospinal neuron axon guidance through spinal cord [Branchiostoma belcheri]